MIRCSGGTRRAHQVHGTSSIHPSISQYCRAGNSSTPPCRHCNETDHNSNGCAMTPFTAHTKGTPHPQQKGKFPMQRGRRPSPYQSRTTRVCLSGNRRKCAFLGTCTFAHSCAVCEGSHQAKNCPRLPTDYPFQAPIRGNTRLPHPGMAKHTVWVTKKFPFRVFCKVGI